MSKSITVESTEELENVVANYAMHGFSVTSKTSKRAILYKKKEFSVLMAVLGLLVCGIGLVIYAILYTMKEDEAIEVVVASPTVTKADE